MHNWRHGHDVSRTGLAGFRCCPPRVRGLVTASVVRLPLTPGPTAEPWHARRTVDEQRAAAWAGQPDAFLSSWAGGVLREALRRSSLLDARPYEIFGQGSRVNNTSIEHASDIDLVLMLKMPFESNVKALDEAGMDNFRERHQAGLYGW